MALPTLDDMTMILNSRQVDLREAYEYSSPDPEPRHLAETLPHKLLSLKTTVPWAHMLVNAIEERAELKDVTLPEDEEFTELLRQWIEDSDLREAMTEAHNECLRTGIAYVVTTGHPDLPNTPLFTAESPRSFYAEVDQRTGKVLWAFRLYCVSPAKIVNTTDDYDAMTVYTANKIEYFRRSSLGIWQKDPAIKDVVHNMGEPPVEALINRKSRLNPFGVPEHRALWRLQDAAARALTNMQIAQEFGAIPQKVITNADEDDFAGYETEDGVEQPVTQAELVLKRFLILTGDAKIAEYSAAQLQNFSTAFNTIARNASAASGMPLDFLGVSSDANPSSGDAIRGSNDRLVKRALRFLRGLTPAWVRIIEKAAYMSGNRRDNLARIKLSWADPSTTTPSATADAALKLSQISTPEGPIFDREYIWKFMDVDPDEQDRMTNHFAEESFQSLLNNQEDSETDTTVEGLTDDDGNSTDA